MSITRSEVLRRAQSVWGIEAVPYSQSRIHPGGYRQDCSGYVSACWGISPSENGGWGGQNTVTLVSRGYMREINVNDLKPGDAIGKCGPSTGGDDGHIQLFCGWDNQNPGDNGHTVLEQSGPNGSPGPHRRHYATWRSGYKAYRFTGIVEDAPAPAPAPAPRPAAPAFPLPGGHYFGLITGPALEHGGANASERAWVRAIQQKLQALGIAPNYAGWADGIYERATFNAVWEFQKRRGLAVDGHVGPQTWRTLFGG